MNGEPKWKGQKITDCLRGEYNANLGGEEFLGVPKEGGRISSEAWGTPSHNTATVEVLSTPATRNRN
jgi:hypothetical protein